VILLTLCRDAASTFLAVEEVLSPSLATHSAISTMELTFANVIIVEIANGTIVLTELYPTSFTFVAWTLNNLARSALD
jgi:hypothetical protein